MYSDMAGQVDLGFSYCTLYLQQGLSISLAFLAFTFLFNLNIMYALNGNTQESIRNDIKVKNINQSICKEYTAALHCLWMPSLLKQFQGGFSVASTKIQI